jgi:hypothetical protein
MVAVGLADQLSIVGFADQHMGHTLQGDRWAKSITSVWAWCVALVYFARAKNSLLEGKRVTQAMFHPKWEEWMFTISSDWKVGFHTFEPSS